MKRTRKRLALEREVIRTLVSNELVRVNGGAIKTYLADVCSYTNSPDCLTGGTATLYC
jgi:hypothetical protein